jgi:DNA invertase Pin-like site-specific DNA recombinase
MSKSKKNKVPYYARTVQVPGPGATVEGQIRYSSRSQGDSLTIESQQYQITHFAEKLGWRVLSWCIEEDVSGGPETIDQRPQWSEHIAKIGVSVDCSVSLDLSRWSRDQVAPWIALRQIRDQGGYWCTTDGQHALDRIEGDIGAQVTFAIGNITNNNYLRQISQRVVLGNATRARQGFHNGPVCFGYVRPPMPSPPPGYNLMSYTIKERLPIIPDEVWNEQAHMTNFQALQHIGELRARGHSFEQIAHWLNNNGFTTGTTTAGKLSEAKKRRYESMYGPHGNRPFIPVGVRAILLSRLPREFVREDGLPSGHGTVYDPVAHVELEGLHVAAWNSSLCERIDLVNKEHMTYNNMGRKTYSERRRMGQYEGVVYIYSGLLVCGCCGSHVNGYKPGVYMDSAFHGSLECRSGRSATIRDLLLDVDMHYILEFALASEVQEQIRQRAQEFADVYRNSQQESPQIVTRRAELDAERKRIVSMFAKGDISESEKDAMLVPIKSELQILRPLPIKIPEVSSDEFIAASEQWSNLAALWRYMTDAQRGEMLGLMIEPRGIVVDMEAKRIIRVRPKPSYIPLCQLTLTPVPEDPGWFHVPLFEVRDREQKISELATLRGIAVRRRKDGTVARGSRYIHPDTVEKMHELRREGLSFAAIAKACGVDVKTVYRYVSETEKGNPPVDNRRRGRYKHLDS